MVNIVNTETVEVTEKAKTETTEQVAGKAGTEMDKTYMNHKQDSLRKRTWLS